MNHKRPLTDSLHALPAILQAISHRVLRALVAFALRVISIARSIAVAISNLIVRASTFVWHLYCRLELSIVEALAGVMLILWSLRLFALFLAPAVIFALFRYWIAAAIYLAVLALAIWKFYSAKAEDIERAAEDQAPTRALLTRILRWAVRAVLALASLIWVTVHLSFSMHTAVSDLSEKWGRAVRDLSSSHSSSRDVHHQPAAALTIAIPQGSAKPLDRRSPPPSAVSASTYSPPQLESPSFNCEKATWKSERMVCSSQALAVLDMFMANAYRDALARAPERAAELRNSQNHWIRKDRESCNDVPCLQQLYVSRIRQLEQF